MDEKLTIPGNMATKDVDVCVRDTDGFKGSEDVVPEEEEEEVPEEEVPEEEEVGITEKIDVEDVSKEQRNEFSGQDFLDPRTTASVFKNS